MKAVLIILFLCKVLMCATTYKNPFRITGVTFDQSNFTFNISWCIDSISLKNGISGGIAASYHQPQSVRPETFFLPGKLCGDTLLSIYDLKFDTTYNIEFWGKYQDNLLFPESSSVYKIRVFSLVKQPVSFFNPAKLTDTVKALDGKVLLWKEQDYLQGIPPHEDTIHYYRPSSTNINGFVQVGTGIRFSNPEPSLPFFIALSIDSVPSFSKIEQVLIYHDSLGFLIPERNCKRDVSGKFVMMKTDRIRFPLVVMVDTIPPAHKLVSNVLSVINSNQLSDTVEISDNSANIAWSFFCMPGEELPLKPVQSGITSGTSSRIICRIPSAGAQISGIRALLVISDGSHSDTVNLSKSGIRSNSDPFTTEPKTLMPLLTTAVLDSPAVSVCLQSLFGAQKTYDKSEFRIFRWTSETDLGIQVNRWVEYEPKYENLFQIKPGALFWLICSESKPIDLGRGTTVPLDKPVSVILPPKNWTDFSNPYAFDIGLSDVFNCSSPESKNLHLYSWKPLPAQKTYSASLMYSAIIPDKSHDTIRTNRNGYTVYNPFDTSITLQFPPYPYGFFKSNLAKTRPDQGFSIKVTLQSGKDTLNSVYCCSHEFNHDTIECPQPPSFSRSEISIEEKNQHLGIISYPQYKSKIFFYELGIRSDDGNQPYSLSAKFISNNIYGMEMKIIDDNQTVRSANSAYIGDLKSRKVMIIAGRSSDIDKFTGKTEKNRILKPLINHHYSNGHLNLSLYNVYQCHCILELYNLQGKLVFRKKWVSGLNHDSSPVPIPASGTYVLRASFKSENLNTHSITQHISCM